MANTPHENYPIPSVKGFTEVHQIPDPGNGNEFTFTLPIVQNVWRYKILSVFYRFNTSGVGGNRYTGLRFHDRLDTFDWFQIRFPMPQEQGRGPRYMYAINYPVQPFWATGTSNYFDVKNWLPLPDVEFTNEQRFSSDTANMNALDNYTLIAIMIRRWIDQRD